MKLLYISAVFLILFVVLLILRWLGNERFTPQAQNIPASVIDHNTTLYKSATNHLASQTQHGSAFVPLGDTNLALVARIMLADAAEKTLDLQYYLFNNDDSGKALLAAVIEAAKRGVKVRLLLDDMATVGQDSNLIHLASMYPNLSIRVFNPVYTRRIRAIDFVARFPRSSRRMHNKSFNADGIISVIGGRNIGNEYFSVNTEVGFLDYDMICMGEVASDVKHEFDTYWYSGVAFDIKTLGQASSDAEYSAWYDTLTNDLKLYRKIVSRLSLAHIFDDKIESYYGAYDVIFDKPTKVLSGLFDRGDWLAPKISQLMEKSTKELLIVSPYFIPGDSGMKLFEHLIKKGVNITILTNSFSANDVAIVHSGYIDYRKRLLKLGVKLYELKSTNPNKKKYFSILGSKRSSLHAKTFLVDRNISFVGSFNLDPRSAIHNTEMGVVIKSAAYGAKAHTNATSLLQKDAYEVYLTADDQIHWREEIIKNGNKQTIIHDQEPSTNLIERAIVYVLSWLPVEWLL